MINILANMQYLAQMDMMASLHTMDVSSTVYPGRTVILDHLGVVVSHICGAVVNDQMAFESLSKQARDMSKLNALYHFVYLGLPAKHDLFDCYINEAASPEDKAQRQLIVDEIKTSQCA